jgi:hypothetical protein
MLKLPPYFTAICLFFLTTTISSFAQTEKDSIGDRMGRMSLEAGVFYAGDDKFQTLFETNSALNFQLSLDLGNTTWKMFPWVKFMTYKFETASNASIDYKAKLNQFSGGLGFPVPLKEDHDIIVRLGISDNRYTVNDTLRAQYGMIMSVGYKRRLHKNFDFMVNGTYNYSKNEFNDVLNDWNGLSFTIGLAANLIGNNSYKKD